MAAIQNCNFRSNLNGLEIDLVTLKIIVHDFVPVAML